MIRRVLACLQLFYESQSLVLKLHWLKNLDWLVKLKIALAATQARQLALKDAHFDCAPAMRVSEAAR